MLFRKLAVGQHPRPVAFRAFTRLREAEAIVPMKALPFLLGVRDGFRRGDSLRRDLRVRLVFERDHVDHVPELVISAPLLRRLWPHVAHGVPQAQRAITAHARRRGQAARREVGLALDEYRSGRVGLRAIRAALDSLTKL